MSYLRPDEDVTPEQIMLWACYHSLFTPPPGVDPVDAYLKVATGCVVLWLHMAVIGLIL